MSSRPQFTITLGRSGQVVKRAGPATDSVLTPSSERKRPIRERLGSNTDNSYVYGSQDNSKRQRTESSSWNTSDDHLSNDEQYTPNRRIGRDDLRFKLVSKSLSRRNSSGGREQHKVDLREKLSRNMQVSPRFDAREHAPGSRNSGLVRRIPPTRSADDLLQLDSLQKSYSSWTVDGLRHRSPDRRRSSDRLLGASRGISPPRNYSELRHVSSVRPNDASRPTSYVRNGVVDASRPTFMGKTVVSVDATKPVLRAPPPGGIIQKSSYALEEPLTVASLLNSLGLGKYAILFQAEEVDMTALKQMGDTDLKELGIPMGPRKKILLAVMAQSKHRHR